MAPCSQCMLLCGVYCDDDENTCTIVEGGCEIKQKGAVGFVQDILTGDMDTLFILLGVIFGLCFLNSLFKDCKKSCSSGGTPYERVKLEIPSGFSNGDRVTSYFKKKDGKKSRITDNGVVIRSSLQDGCVHVQFDDAISQNIPLAWVSRQRSVV